MRRFLPPWTVERLPGGFKVIDGNDECRASSGYRPPTFPPATMITTAADASANSYDDLSRSSKCPHQGGRGAASNSWA